MLKAPEASAAKEVHADWLELMAVSSADGNSSIQDLVSVLRSSGTLDALQEYPEGDIDRGSEASQQLAETAFAEIEDRARSCSGSAAATYPFVVGEQYIQLSDEKTGLPYLFLLLLSFCGPGVGPRGIAAERLFEDLSLVAAQAYFGGAEGGVGMYPFGFPRRIGPSGFQEAVEALCAGLGEGGGSKDRPKRKSQKDAKLDLAVWKPFLDGRQGKLIGFGQCATGKDWKTKISELHPPAWCKAWLKETPPVDPVSMFFVPYRIDAGEWETVTPFAGVVFDRCRIASLAQPLPAQVAARLGRWTQHAREEVAI